MLVHICCSVDSHYYLGELKKFYPNKTFVGFFYNPNIHPKEEHDLRLLDVERSCKMLNIKLICGEYEMEEWLASTKGLEEEPEKGKRCTVCFDERLIKTANLAKKLDIKEFTTTLLSSPMKTQEVLYAQGDKIAIANNLDFIKINVRKNGGVERQNALAKSDNLYRQNYCGCTHALSKQRASQKKSGLEMLSNITRQVMPGSIEHRMSVFTKRNEIESENKGYILQQHKNIVWRVLNAKLIHKNEILESYIIARSCSKNKIKSGNIVWIKQRLFTHYPSFMQDLFKDMQADYRRNLELLVGYSKRDDSIFIDIKMLNFLLKKDFKDVRDIRLEYAEELLVRDIISGSESVNPIIVLNTQVPFDIVININSMMQEENIFKVIESI